MTNIIGNAEFIKNEEELNHKIRYIHFKNKNVIGIECNGLILRYVKYKDMKKVFKYLRYLRKTENEKMNFKELL